LFQQLFFSNVAYQLAQLKTIVKPWISLSRSSRTGARAPFFSYLTADRDRTVSRRSKPSSRTILTVEQTDPWKIIHNQDMMSRHRGANRLRRWELLGVISLLSLAYLLFVNRYLFR
jgi:hypothetical protein